MGAPGWTEPSFVAKLDLAYWIQELVVHSSFDKGAELQNSQI